MRILLLQAEFFNALVFADVGSIVYDVLDDYIVHASFQRYLASERSAALEHLHNLEDLNIYQNSVVIFDRGYYSEDMFRYCVEHQHLCLMRLKQNYNIAKKCSGDIITVLPGNTKDGTEDIRIRVIEVILNDGTKEYLATNLFGSHISQQMFFSNLPSSFLDFAPLFINLSRHLS